MIIAHQLLNIRPHRSSILPYRLNGDVVEFLLGRDAKSMEWTDFGGGVKKFEVALNASYREFQEESKECFPSLKLNDLSTCAAFCSPFMSKDIQSVIFLPIDYETSSRAETNFYDSTFNVKYRRKCYNEMNAVAWVPESEWKKMLNGHHTEKLWSKCRRFYHRYLSSNHVRSLLISAYHYKFPAAKFQCTYSKV